MTILRGGVLAYANDWTIRVWYVWFILCIIVDILSAYIYIYLLLFGEDSELSLWSRDRDRQTETEKRAFYMSVRGSDPPSLLSLSIKAAISNIHHIHNLSSIPDPLVTELFQVKQKHLLSSSIPSFLSFFLSVCFPFSLFVSTNHACDDSNLPGFSSLYISLCGLSVPLN